MSIVGDYIIKFAEYGDIPSIMQYIDLCWKKNHILSCNRELFEWQYVRNKKVCFVIAVDGDNRIAGILGYVPYNKDDIVLALWKADHTVCFLGVRLILFLMENIPHKNILCNGINLRTTEKVYRKLGMNIGILNHWYRLRRSTNYQIALISQSGIPNISICPYKVKKLTSKSEFIKSWEHFNCHYSVPAKDSDYLSWRYFDHPGYEYYMYSVCSDNGDVLAYFVLRLQECNGSRCCRFIDYVGEHSYLSNVTSVIDELLCEFDAEYIDMYETGLEDSYLLAGGWLPVKDSGNIIPNYFAPFEQRNIDIYYSASTDVCLFKGDGDQDRPN